MVLAVAAQHGVVVVVEQHRVVEALHALGQIGFPRAVGGVGLERDGIAGRHGEPHRGEGVHLGQGFQHVAEEVLRFQTLSTAVGQDGPAGALALVVDAQHVLARQRRFLAILAHVGNVDAVRGDAERVRLVQKGQAFFLQLQNKLFDGQLHGNLRKNSVFKLSS